MADTTEKTVAEELKQAVTTLRCDHRFPCQPPHGTVWAPGPCLLCGIPCPDDDEEIPDALREPLASWLETEAHMAEKRGNSSDGHTFHALAVARVLNGGDRG